MGGGSSKDGGVGESRLCKQLFKFVRKGTLHLEITAEDSLAYEKLRQEVYAAEDPMAISVFDLALFISMSMECAKLLELHTRLRECEGDARTRATKEFRVLALKACYRFMDGTGGFSQLVTFAVLTNLEFTCSMLDPRTQMINKVLFAKNACYMKDSLEEALDANVSSAVQSVGPAGEQTLVVRLRKAMYAHVEGTNVKCEPLESGICDHYKKWLAYAKSFRASMELPQGGNTLLAAVGLLMEFEGR